MITLKYSAVFSVLFSVLIGSLHFLSHAWVSGEQMAGEALRGSKLYKYFELVKNDGAPSASVPDFVSRAAAKHQVPEALIYGLMEAESSQNTEAFSIKGAIGLLQIMPANAKRCGVKPSKLWDEEVNISCGAQILSEELKTYNGNLVSALMSYNGGPQCVRAKCRESVEHVGKVAIATSKRLIRG